MAGHVSPLRALARDADLRRAAGALALFGLAEYGPWVAMLVYAYGQGGATATGLVSLALLLPTALFAPCCGPLIDRFGASSVLFGAFAGQAVAMAATAVSLLAGAPPVVTYTLGALTAMALTTTHPAFAVVSPGIARTAGRLVALNAVTGWIFSVGIVIGPACAGLILAVSTPGAVYAAGAVCVGLSALLFLPLRDLLPAQPHDADEPRVSAARQLDEGARDLARRTPRGRSCSCSPPRISWSEPSTCSPWCSRWERSTWAVPGPAT